MNNNERAENFLRKSLEGVCSEAEIEEMVYRAKNITRMFNTKFSDFIHYFLHKFSQIIGKNELETYKLLLGESN